MVRCPELDLKVSELSCVSRSGTLVRRGRHLHHWTKRHVVIAANFIFYYKHIGDKPAGVIWLDDAKAATVPAVDGRRHCFEVVTRAKRVFTFQGQNRRDTLQWVTAINGAAYTRIQERFHETRALLRLCTGRMSRLGHDLSASIEGLVDWFARDKRFVTGRGLRAFQSVAPAQDGSGDVSGVRPRRSSIDAADLSKERDQYNAEIDTHLSHQVHINRLREIASSVREIGGEFPHIGDTTPLNLGSGLGAAPHARHTLPQRVHSPIQEQRSKSGGSHRRQSAKSPLGDATLGAAPGVASPPTLIPSRAKSSVRRSSQADDVDIEPARPFATSATARFLPAHGQIHNDLLAVASADFGYIDSLERQARTTKQTTAWGGRAPHTAHSPPGATATEHRRAREDDGSGTDLGSAAAVDQDRAREFSFCQDDRTLSPPSISPVATPLGSGGDDTGSVAHHRIRPPRQPPSSSGVSTSEGSDALQASPSITQRHIPLTRGKPVTPNRDIQASQPRVVPGHRDMEGGKTVRARMPEVSDSRNRDAAGAAYPLPVHVTVDAHQPSAQHPPPTLHATRGRRDTGSGAASRAGPAPEPQEGHRRPTLPAKTASWSEGVHAAASRRAASPRREEDAHVGLRSRRSPPVSPAVQALSHSDGSLERRNSMSHSMKPVWELQEAHLSGSLEPEPFFHHFHDHQSDLDEAILLSVQSLHQPGHDSDESHGDDDDGLDDHEEGATSTPIRAARSATFVAGDALIVSPQRRQQGAAHPPALSPAHPSPHPAAAAAAAAADTGGPPSTPPPPHHPTHARAHAASTTPATAVAVAPVVSALRAELEAQRAASGQAGQGSGSSTRQRAASMASPGAPLKGPRAHSLEVLRRMLLAPSGSLLHAFLQGVPTRAKDLPLPMLRVFARHGGQAWLRVLGRAAVSEVNSAATVSSMFRTERIGGRLLRVFALSCGALFLHSALAAPVANLSDAQARLSECQLEIDPNRVSPTRSLSSQDVAARNSVRLLDTAQLFMDGILADLPNLPPSFRFVCARLMKASNAKFHDASSIPHRSGYINNAAAAAVGGFLFLRLITPALMSPSAHGLITTSPCSFARRSLLLVAKLLQATISGADVGRKDPFFAPTCTAFVNTNRPRLLHAFAQLGTVARGVDPTVACGSDAEVFCAGGAVIEQDLAAILDVATLPANAAALIEHLPPSSSPGMRAAFRHLMTADTTGASAEVARSPSTRRRARSRNQSRSRSRNREHSGSRRRAIATVGDLVGGRVRYTASSRGSS